MLNGQLVLLTKDQLLNKFHIIIHCAALARMSECELNKKKAYSVNVMGTSNLIELIFFHICPFISNMVNCILWNGPFVKVCNSWRSLNSNSIIIP